MFISPNPKRPADACFNMILIPISCQPDKPRYLYTKKFLKLLVVPFLVLQAYPMPTYLNQFGLQSSFINHASPSVNRPVMQPLHFGLLGQLK